MGMSNGPSPSVNARIERPLPSGLQDEEVSSVARVVARSEMGRGVLGIGHDAVREGPRDGMPLRGTPAPGELESGGNVGCQGKAIQRPSRADTLPLEFTIRTRLAE